MGWTVRMAGLSTPGMLPRVKMAKAMAAPELPAETTPSTLPSFSRVKALFMDESFFRRRAIDGESSMHDHRRVHDFDPGPALKQRADDIFVAHQHDVRDILGAGSLSPPHHGKRRMISAHSINCYSHHTG